MTTRLKNYIKEVEKIRIQLSEIGGERPFANIGCFLQFMGVRRKELRLILVPLSKLLCMDIGTVMLFERK